MRFVGRWGPVGLLVLIALSASAIGLHNTYTYDDKWIIQANRLVHDLHNWRRLFTTTYWPRGWGAEGYRPLTTLLFTVQWVVGHGSPVLYHAVNLALYAGTTVAVYALTSVMLPTSAAWLAAALFAAHPVHVEAVANVVGQAELSTALVTMLAVWLYLRTRRNGPLPPRVAVGLVVLYAVACLMKEHGIVLPALLVFAEVLLVDDARPLRTRFRELRPFALALLAVAVGFLAVRATVLGSTGFAGFAPFVVFQTLKLSAPDRVLTMIGVVPEWLRLFLWPARLSTEYAPPYIDVAQGPGIAQLPGLLLLVGIFGVAVALRRRQPTISFGIAWIVITLLPTSNFIVPAGILLAERTLFLPSVGAMIAVAACVVWAAPLVRAPSLRVTFAAAAAALIVAGVVRSARRTTVWHDNERLFRQAVVDAPLSYRAHYMFGSWLFEQKRKREAEVEYLAALKLFPYDPNIAFAFGEQYRASGMFAQAVPYYRWARAVDPNFFAGSAAFALCLLQLGRYADAKAEALRAVTHHGDARLLHRIAFLADSARAADSDRPPKVELVGSPSKVPHSMQKTSVGEGHPSERQSDKVLSKR